MEFKTLDGQHYKGRGYRSIVGAMSNHKLRTPRNLRVYRRATARRVASMYDVVIDERTDKSFINDLVDVGLLVRVK